MIQQRLGESDADYEARKKRVRRTRQGVDFGLAHAGGGSGAVFKTNVCITQGNDGIVTWYGATLTDPPFGSINPTITVEGQTVYAFKWKADGVFRMRFGDIGNEPVTDTNIILVAHDQGSLALSWDEANLYYEGTDSALATSLIAAYVEGEDTCFRVQIIPDEFISYNFDLLRGTA